MLFAVMCGIAQQGQHGDVVQMVERPLSMREVLGSMPNFSSYAHECMDTEAG